MLYTEDVENIKKHFYGRVSKATDDNMTWLMRFACWITKTTDTLRKCNNYYYSRQQWLCECASMLRYTYTACLCYYLFRFKMPFVPSGR